VWLIWNSQGQLRFVQFGFALAEVVDVFPSTSARRTPSKSRFPHPLSCLSRLIVSFSVFPGDAERLST
jgi:hypothetical protein